MSTQLGVFIIHGMGDPEPSYAAGLIKRLRKRLGGAANRVEFEACYWAPFLQNHQDEIWRRLKHSGGLDKRALRRWVLSALGDPATYLSGYFKAGKPVYDEIHECVRASLEKLATGLGGVDRPLMVLAHSLGSVIVSNYLWDEETGKGIGTTPFEKGETLVSLVTYGSNIPLFIPPTSPITCVRFPSPALPPKYAKAARWDNVYDPDDVLGYPMSEVWDDKQGTTIFDKAINAGGLLGILGETPFSHVLYDRDDDFLDMVEQRMNAVLAIP